MALRSRRFLINFTATGNVDQVLQQQAWETFPIVITGVQLAIDTGTIDSMLVENKYANGNSPDTMLVFVSGQTPAPFSWLPPNGFAFPAIGDVSVGFTPLINVYLHAVAGTAVSFYLVIFYVPQA